MQIKEIEVLHLLEEPARRRLAEEKLETIEEQIADYEDQLAKLTLVAPISGTVVEAPRTPAALAAQPGGDARTAGPYPVDRSR